MRTIVTLVGLAVMAAGLAVADSWSGKLLDANCLEKEKGAKACDATGNTAAFALEVSGKVYRLDAAGNTKAAEAIKSRADRASEPGKPAEGSAAVSAKVTGNMDGETIKVDAIEVR